MSARAVPTTLSSDAAVCGKNGCGRSVMMYDTVDSPGCSGTGISPYNHPWINVWISSYLEEHDGGGDDHHTLDAVSDLENGLKV